MGLESASFLDGLVTTNPVASDTVAQGDDHLRLIKTTLKGSFPNITYARYLEQARADVADAATPALWAATTNYANLLGSTTITGFVSGTSGQMKVCRVNAARTLTHHASTLQLPGAANITAAAGDHFGVVCEGTTANRVLWYERANGKAVAETFPLPVTADVGNFLQATGVGTVAYAQPIPPGIIAMWPRGDASHGRLECNAQAVLRSSPLGTFLGLVYGSGNGTTTCNVPDLRGEFVRGWDHGRGADPNAATRTARPDGGLGDNPGTLQADEFESHTHNIQFQSTLAGGGGGQVTDLVEGGSNKDTDARGGSETRPRNVYMMYIIKE